MAEDIPDLEAAAYHEAGHAVIAVALGKTPGPVFIRPRDGRWEGSTSVNPQDLEGWSAIVIGCGGLLAQSRLRSGDPPEGYESDMSHVWTGAAALCRDRWGDLGDDKKDYLGYLVVAAMLAGRLLKLAWEHVESVAQALLVGNHRIDDLAEMLPRDELQRMWKQVAEGA
jgi:hypothetical protein